MKTYGACAVFGTLVLASSGLAFSQSLQALSQYSVITSGNLTSTRDIEGRTLVGGNLTSGNSSNFAIHMPDSTSKTDNTLIVQGDILNGGPLNVQRGSVSVGGTTNGRIINYNGGGSLVHNTTNYSSVFNELNLASQTLSTTASNSIVIFPNGQPTSLTFNATAGSNGTAVFNFDGSQLFSNNSIQSINFTPNGATDIVFNVSGTSINWNASSNMLGNFNSTDWRGNIVWNFYQATTIDFGSHDMMGQVLAPLAAVSSSNNIDGSIYAKSLNSNGEVHFPGYDGNINVVPEPSAMLLGALGVLALLRRRR
jgi:choice-of-anchor A domain-containing protein